METTFVSKRSLRTSRLYEVPSIAKALMKPAKEPICASVQLLFAWLDYNIVLLLDGPKGDKKSI